MVFWSLTRSESEKRLADWPEDEDIEFRRMSCPVEASHYRLEGRITPLSVALPNLELRDFVWVWGGECLVQQHLLYLLQASGFTGYDAVPVQKVRFANGTRKPPKLWEIVITGSGGMASPESGVRVRKVCPGCGRTDYSRVTESTKLIDPAQWDGSDFFRVKPIGGFIFVTDRVVKTLRDNAITGWKAQSLQEIQTDLDSIMQP